MDALFVPNRRSKTRAPWSPRSARTPKGGLSPPMKTVQNEIEAARIAVLTAETRGLRQVDQG